jgi:hypothetical protein
MASHDPITSVSDGGSLIEGPGNANVLIALTRWVGAATRVVSAESGSQPT